MKFIIDECIGLVVVRWLRTNGYDVVSIKEIASGSVDDSVLQWAFLDNRILVTSDRDFGELVFKHNRPHCGIILLRLSNEQSSHKIKLLEQILKNYSYLCSE